MVAIGSVFKNWVLTTDILFALGTSMYGESTPHDLKPAALKLKDACKYLGGISPITLRRLIARGLIKPNRALRHILIAKKELDRFLESTK